MLLTGIRVVDWSEGLSAPFAARLLGDLGAEVLRLERPGGDPLRDRGPFWPGEDGPDRSALFAYVNAGKRIVGGELDDHLVGADLLIESQADAPDTVAWQARHTSLVVLSLTPFGRRGPLAGVAATDYTLQHRAAFAWNMARPVGDPASRGPLAGADHEGPLAVGVTGALAAMWGLLIAQSGGVAPHIDLSSHDFYAHIAFEGLAEWLSGTREFPRGRVRREGTEAAGGLTWILPCDGGWVMVSPREQHQWDRWTGLLGQPAWSRDAAFCGTRVERRRNWFELQAAMSDWSKTRSPEAVSREAQAVSVACFPVSTPAALLRNAQLLHRGLFDRLTSPGGRTTAVPGLPMQVRTTGGAELPRQRTLSSPAQGAA